MPPPYVFRFCQPSSRREETAAVELLSEYLGWMLKLEPLAREAPRFRETDAGCERLSDDYKPPHGRFILATHRGRPAGCIALVPQDAWTGCVMRLFVRPEYRGQGLARSLVRQLVARARRIGYRRLLLESHVSMTNAHRIYAEQGFLVVNPPDDLPFNLRRAVICMEWLGSEANIGTSFDMQKR
jgi:GNAT superfamily N-acetyltransferase